MTSVREKSSRPAIWGLFVALAWLAWNPFGVMTKADTAGQSLLFNLTAPMLSARRAPIAVVMIDDDVLVHFGATWPMRYEGHAAVLDAIAERRPKAIFLDFAFVDERTDDPTFDSLMEALERASQSSEVFLAAAPKVVDSIARVRPELEALATRNPRVHLVSTAISPEARAKGQYDVRPHDGLPNASWEMARIVRRDAPAMPSGPIELIWRPPVATSCAIEGCAAMSPNPVLRTLRLIGAGLLPGVSIPSLGVPETYRYVAEPYVRPDVRALIERTSGEDLAGALVFVGGSFALATDSAPNYLYRSMPNVFAHATATDNLITFDAGPIVACPPILGCTQAKEGQRLHSGVVVAFLWLAALGGWALALGIAPLGANPSRTRRLSHRFIEEGAVWLAMGAIFVVEIAVLRLAPAQTFGAFAAFSLRRLDFGLGGAINRGAQAVRMLWRRT